MTEIDELGRCEVCGRLIPEADLTEFMGDLLCSDDLETAEEEYELIE